MNAKQHQHGYLIAALFLIITINTMGIGFVGPLFGPLFTGKDTTLFTSAVSMEWRNILYGITVGIASFMAFLGAPILGNISDHIGRRQVLFFCLIGTSIGMGIAILGIVFNQVLLLIFSRAWLGAVAASQVIAKAAIIDMSSFENKSSRMGVISAASNIGFIFGPVISSILIDNTLVSWFNLTTPFYFAAILALVSAIFLLKVFPSVPKSMVRPTPISPLSSKLFIFTQVITHKPLRAIALIYFFLQVGWALYLQTNFLTLIQHYNYTSRLLGYYLAWLGVIFCGNLLVVTRFLMRRVALTTVIAWTFMGAASCCLVNALYPTPTSIWLNMVPMATVIALGSNAILVGFSNLAKAHEQGWIMGIGKSLAALAWAITPPLTGAIVGFGFSLPLFIAAGLFFLGIIILVSSWRRP